VWKTCTGLHYTGMTTINIFVNPPNLLNFKLFDSEIVADEQVWTYMQLNHTPNGNIHTNDYTNCNRINKCQTATQSVKTEIILR